MRPHFSRVQTWFKELTVVHWLVPIRNGLLQMCGGALLLTFSALAKEWLLKFAAETLVVSGALWLSGGAVIGVMWYMSWLYYNKSGFYD